MAEQRCPGCKESTLEPVEDRGVAFLGCTACYGLFASEDDLAAYAADWAGQPGAAEAFRQLLTRSLQGGARTGIRACPVCAGKLQRLGFGEAPLVIIDRCPDHGVWLDPKELKKLVRATRAFARVEGLIGSSYDLAADEHEDEDD